jgi:hypothetical protein
MAAVHSGIPATMVTRRALIVVVACATLAALGWLYDPPWLINQTTGLRRWEERDGLHFRWSGAHASFFVPSSARAFEMPVSTSFADGDKPMMVTVSVDDQVVARTVLSDPGWKRIRVPLPPPGRRKVRRIDVRTSITRDGNRGVRIGPLEFVPKVAAKLLPSRSGGASQPAELDRYRGGVVRRFVERRPAALPIALRLSRPDPGDAPADELAHPAGRRCRRSPGGDGAAP